jgi:activator of HSP90 ATPase
MSDRIHQEIDFAASPDRIYQALTDAKSFADLSDAGAAAIVNEPGGAISLFGGYVTGRNIDLVPNQRVVQAWRSKTWEEGVYSIARFEIEAQGSGTRLVFDHTGFPEKDREHLEQGWHRMYWDPLRRL